MDIYKKNNSTIIKELKCFLKRTLKKMFETEQESYMYLGSDLLFMILFILFSASLSKMWQSSV